MKKLIEELELERADMSRSNCDYGELSGFAAAVDIVRAHNPWHEVSELPEPDKLLWFLCRDGSVFLGYYASYIEDGETCYCWSEQDGTFYREGSEIIASAEFDDYDVTHYRYIPTDLPELPNSL